MIELKPRTSTVIFDGVELGEIKRRLVGHDYQGFEFMAYIGDKDKIKIILADESHDNLVDKVNNFFVCAANRKTEQAKNLIIEEKETKIYYKIDEEIFCLLQINNEGIIVQFDKNGVFLSVEKLKEIKLYKKESEIAFSRAHEFAFETVEMAKYFIEQAKELYAQKIVYAFNKHLQEKK